VTPTAVPARGSPGENRRPGVRHRALTLKRRTRPCAQRSSTTGPATSPVADPRRPWRCVRRRPAARPADDEIEQAHGLPAGALAAAALAPARGLPAVTGEITDEQWRFAVAVDLANTYGSPSSGQTVSDMCGGVSRAQLRVDGGGAGHMHTDSSRSGTAPGRTQPLFSRCTRPGRSAVGLGRSRAILRRLHPQTAAVLSLRGGLRLRRSGQSRGTGRGCSWRSPEDGRERGGCWASIAVPASSGTPAPARPWAAPSPAPPTSYGFWAPPNCPARMTARVRRR